MLKQIANNISDNNEENEIISFGLERLKVVIIAVTVVIITGVILHETKRTFILIISILPLRQNAGGYHLKKNWQCTVCSYIILVLMIFVLKYVDFNNRISAILLICSMTIIYLLSPVSNENHRLDNAEKKVYGHRARTVCCIESFSFLILFCLAKSYWYKIVLISEMAVAVLLILGKIQEWIFEREFISDL